MAPDTCSRGVQLSVGGAKYPNNSVIGWNVLLETRKPLQCTTQLRPCCHIPPHRHGHWLYPNGTLEQLNYLFYSSRGDDGTVTLHLRSNRRQNQRMKMKLCCEIPGTNRIPQRLCAILGESQLHRPHFICNLCSCNSITPSDLNYRSRCTDCSSKNFLYCSTYYNTINYDIQHST